MSVLLLPVGGKGLCGDAADWSGAWNNSSGFAGTFKSLPTVDVTGAASRQAPIIWLGSVSFCGPEILIKLLQFSQYMRIKTAIILQGISQVYFLIESKLFSRWTVFFFYFNLLKLISQVHHFLLNLEKSLNSFWSSSAICERQHIWLSKLCVRIQGFCCETPDSDMHVESTWMSLACPLWPLMQIWLSYMVHVWKITTHWVLLAWGRCTLCQTMFGRALWVKEHPYPHLLGACTGERWDEWMERKINLCFAHWLSEQ